MSVGPNEQVAWLTDRAAGALATARSLVQVSADDLTDVSTLLRRGEDDIDELTAYAAKVRDIVEVEPETFLRHAATQAEYINTRLTAGRTEIGEIQDRLERADQALRECGQALDELGGLPEGRTDEAAHLYQRLGGLRRAVGAAQEQLAAADDRLRRGQANVETLRNPVLHASRGAAESLIRDTHSDVSADADAARQGLREAAEGLDDAHPNFSLAAAHGEELARSAYAGLNPTPASQQVTPGSAGSDTRRSAGDSRQTDLER